MIALIILRKKIVIIAATILGFTGGNTFAADYGPQFESVWAWKITTEKRTVYLLGELHNFGGESLNLSHKLGGEIYNISKEIWTENSQINSGNYEINSYLKPETIIQVRRSLKEAINQTSNKSEQGKIELLTKVMEDFYKSDPITAHNTLMMISSLKIFKRNPIYKSYAGFINTMRKQLDNNQSKLMDIESATAVEDTWRQYCQQKNKAEEMIHLGLEKLNLEADSLSTFFNETIEAFANKNNELSEITDFLSKRKDAVLMNECSIAPRNKNWLPKILNSLSTQGPPVAFVVGIAHMGGTSGLISLLKKEGYQNIERVRTTD